MYEIDKWKRFSNVWGNGWKKTLFWIYFLKTVSEILPKRYYPKRPVIQTMLILLQPLSLGSKFWKPLFYTLLGTSLSFWITNGIQQLRILKYHGKICLLGKTTKRLLSGFESWKPQKHNQLWTLRPDPSCLYFKKRKIIKHKIS